MNEKALEKLNAMCHATTCHKLPDWATEVAAVAAPPMTAAEPNVEAADAEIPQEIAEFEAVADGLPADPYHEIMTDADRDWFFNHVIPERCPWCEHHHVHDPRCVSLCDEWAITMPFGKFKGRRISEIEPDYLRWLLKAKVELVPELRAEVDRALGRAAA